MRVLKNSCLMILSFAFLFCWGCKVQSAESETAIWAPKRLLDPHGVHADWQPVPVPKGWDRDRLWNALCKHLKEQAASKLPGSNVELKHGYIKISFETRKYDLPVPQIKNGRKRMRPPKVGPEPHGFILSVGFEDGVGQLARPQELKGLPWTILLGPYIYLPELKLYLPVTVQYGSETDKRLLAELCAPTRWLKAVFAGG